MVRSDYIDNDSYTVSTSQGEITAVSVSVFRHLPVVSHFMNGVFYMKPPTPRLSFTWNGKCLIKILVILDPSAGLTLKMLSLKLPAVLALTCSARAHELIKLDLDFVSIKSDFWELSLAEHTRCQELVTQLEKFLYLLSQTRVRVV